MEATFNIKAIILDKKDFREADSRIICYCADRGKLELIVRGGKKVKSKLAGHTEPLTLTSFMVITGKDFNYAGTAQGEIFFSAIKSDLDKINIAGQALRLVNKMTREGEADGHAEIFNLLKIFLEELENSPLERGVQPQFIKTGDGQGVSKQSFFFTQSSSVNKTVLTHPALRAPLSRGELFEKELTEILGFSQEDFEELKEK